VLSDNGSRQPNTGSQLTSQYKKVGMCEYVC